MNAVPRLRFEMLGAPRYDPRKDSSRGGSGSHRLDDPLSWQQTVNPIVNVWNIHHGIRLPGGRIWGGRDAPEDLPQAVWWAAMNECDLGVEAEEGEFEPQFRCGIEAQLSEEPASVLTELYKACQGEVAEVGGE